MRSEICFKKCLHFVCVVFCFSFLTVFMGCVATQKDITFLQSDMTKLQDQLTEMQKNQGDLSVEMEDLNSNIKSLDSKIEDTNDKFSTFGQKLDDNSVDFTNKLTLLSNTVTKKIEETKPTPSQVYGTAYADYTMNNYDLALAGFQEYLQQYPQGTLAPDAQFAIGNCYFDKGDYENAADGFDVFVSSYPKDGKVPSALLKEANSLLKLDRKTEAIAVFRYIVKKYPKTNEARQARSYIPAQKKPTK